MTHSNLLSPAELSTTEGGMFFGKVFHLNTTTIVPHEYKFIIHKPGTDDCILYATR